MIINHNLLSMNADRNLKINTGNKAKSTERLSSGYRINRAADNAAGLSISEKMRSQIRGLDQASLNAQDGISLLQTADGALSEDHSILQRMRELTVQAANDTNTDIDRDAIKEELSQLTKELDRISDQTEFNTRKLLDGSLYSKTSNAAQEQILKWLKGTWMKDALTRITQATGLGLNTNATLNVNFKDLGNSVIANMGSYNGGSTFTLNFNTYFLTDNTSYGEDGPKAAGLYLDRLITHEFTHAIMRHNSSPGLNTPMWFREGLAEVTHGASDYRFTDGNVASAQSSAASIMSSFDFANDPNEYDAYPAGYLAVSYLYNYNGSNGSYLKGILSNMDSYTDFSDCVEATFASLGTTITYEDLLTQMKSDAASNISDFITNKCAIDFSDGDPDAVGMADGSSEDVVKETGTAAASINPTSDTISIDGTHNLTFIWPDISKKTDFNLQVGANSNQSLSISLRNMNSESLFGVNSIDISNHQQATRTIKTIDDAIKSVSEQRSNVGALTNRLEHTISNLDNTSENTSNAESRIRDTDMAKEMVNYSKSNILEQAAQSILAQANTQPNLVLQLLG